LCGKNSNEKDRSPPRSIAPMPRWLASPMPES
jgi:hypothetical protein